LPCPRTVFSSSGVPNLDHLLLCLPLRVPRGSLYKPQVAKGVKPPTPTHTSHRSSGALRNRCTWAC
jgi:hypothetical protein